MFKRMSVLVRRDDHDRARFSQLWERHAAPVSGLPKVRGYIQNHIVADYSATPPIAADGFVELMWDRPEDMAAAFASPAARPMVEDEPGFLGHGSGYALRHAEPLKEAGDGKLLVAAVGEPDPVRRLMEAAAEEMDGLTALLLDEVASLIPKPGMAPPQPVRAFAHLWFEASDAAAAAGRRLGLLRDDAVRLGVWGVRTIRFV